MNRRRKTSLGRRVAVVKAIGAPLSRRLQALVPRSIFDSAGIAGQFRGASAALPVRRDKSDDDQHANAAGCLPSRGSDAAGQGHA